MESFGTYLKRHGLKLWLFNLLGIIASSTVLVFLGVIIFFLALLTGFFTIYSLGNVPVDLTSPDFGDQLATIFQYASLGVIGIILFLLIYFLLVALVSSFQSGGQYAVANEAIKFDRVNIGTYFTSGFKNVFKLFLLSIISFFIYLPALILIGIGIWMMVPFNDFVLIIIGSGIILIAILLIFLVSIAIIHAPFILVAENSGIIQSLIYSFRLFSKKFGQVFITCLSVFGVFLLYLFGEGLINLPVLLSILDPTSIFFAISAIIVNLLQIAYRIAGLPLMVSISGLIIAYRYYKYLRPSIFTQQFAEKDNQEPIFTFKDNKEN